MLAGQLRGVPVAGTLAHSFITSFLGTEVPPDPVSTSLPRRCTPESRTQSWSLPRGGMVLQPLCYGRCWARPTCAPWQVAAVLRRAVGSPSARVS